MFSHKNFSNHLNVCLFKRVFNIFCCAYKLSDGLINYSFTFGKVGVGSLCKFCLINAILADIFFNLDFDRFWYVEWIDVTFSQWTDE